MKIRENINLSTIFYLLVAGCTHVPDHYIRYNGEEWPTDIAKPTLPQYDKHGQEIFFVPDYSLLPPFGVAWSRYESGTGIPLVEYVVPIMKEYPKELQKFIFYHEVGHFKLGHNDQGHYESTKDKLKDERDAHCYAIKNFDTKEQDRIWNFLRAEGDPITLRYHFSECSKFPKPEESR